MPEIAAARKHISTEALFNKQDEAKQHARPHKPICATCRRPLDVWPDGTVLHKDARFDMATFPEHHKAVELP